MKYVMYSIFSTGCFIPVSLHLCLCQGFAKCEDDASFLCVPSYFSAGNTLHSASVNRACLVIDCVSHSKTLVLHHAHQWGVSLHLYSVPQSQTKAVPKEDCPDPICVSLQP